MREVPPELYHRLQQHRQEHLLFGWDTLSPQQRQELVAQLQAVDFAQLEGLFQRKDASAELADRSTIAPIPIESAEQISRSTIQWGEEALCAGQVAALVVAGGQGTRLGSTQPKGMYPITPVRQRSLFEWHAEKVLAIGRRYGRPLPFLVMTSPATHRETINYFEEKRYFDLGRDNVYFFQQGTMPAMDLRTGQLLLEQPGRLCLSPNGHGGTLLALAQSGLLEQLRQQGIRQIFYFQVDNPLVKIADPAFLGRHLEVRAEVSSKVIEKREPNEKMGVFALTRGRCSIIEYSDLPSDLAEQRDPNGKLTYCAGNPAIHIFEIAFLCRITQGKCQLPYHLARKKMPYLDTSGSGQLQTPTTENALKFEMFIFDALPLADRWLCLETPREQEFAPLKNASGADSPATVRQALSELAAQWLQRVGLQVPRDAQGQVLFPMEIAPLFALDAEAFEQRVRCEGFALTPVP